MPKIKVDSAVVAYGENDSNSNLSFRERLMKRFSSHEWVRVINPDDEMFRWQYLPAHAEEFEFTPDPMKYTRRGEVEVYQLAPGESEVLIGENAYLMIEALYKKLVSKKVVAKTPDTVPGQARNFNWTDGKAQDEMIDLIYLGKENPSFGAKKARGNDLPPAIEKPLLATTNTNRIRKA